MTEETNTAACGAECTCGHSHKKAQNSHSKSKPYYLYLIVFLYLLAAMLELPALMEKIIYLLAYVMIGWQIIWSALQNIAKGKVFDENFLMALATFGAIAIGKYEEAVAVMLFYKIGQYFEDIAVDKSQHSIRALMDIKAAYANVKRGDDYCRVNPEEVYPGDIILIKPGERIPLDGKVISGSSAVDTSSLTGETLKRYVEPGAEVLSGFINQEGLLQVEVQKEYADSTVARIIELVKNASGKKAQVERTISRFARYYTPAVIITAAAVAFITPLITALPFKDSLYRALIFLVVSCPCALVISVPLSYFGGVGGAARKGILIKGGNYLEALNRIDTLVFDKTGTLTKGRFIVKDIFPDHGFSRRQLIDYAVLAESYSSHPLAKAVVDSFGPQETFSTVEDYEEKAGYGVKVKADSKEILAGSRVWLENNGVAVAKNKTDDYTSIFVAVDKEYAGQIILTDELKDGLPQTFKALKQLGVKRLYLLTGDNQSAAQNSVGSLGFDKIYANLLPHEKVEKLEEILRQKGNGSVVYVGDGINDAPVLARADVGIAMGGLGADAAIEAADVVLMTDEPANLVTAAQIAKKTQAIVWQNIIIALGLKAIILGLGAVGIATMWAAIFADVGVALLAILNAMRAISVSKVNV